MYKNKFVLSIIHDGHPIKESGRASNREAAIPFNSEYQIRLKNKHNRSCTARVFIDDKKVSQLGDFIVNAGGTIDLERFVTKSLNRGKRFKFVPLNHPDVDDPTDSKNGLIKVEFRLSKRNDVIWIDTDEDFVPDLPPWRPPPRPPTPGPWKYFYTDDVGGLHRDNGTTSDPMYTASNMHTKSRKSSTGRLSGQMLSSVRNVSEAGATIEGRRSNQSFSYSSLDVESHSTILRLKLVGLRDRVRTASRYCRNCGNAVGKSDKYCANCGSRV